MLTARTKRTPPTLPPVLGGVMDPVAALAEGPQVRGRVVARVVVKVGAGQNQVEVRTLAKVKSSLIAIRLPRSERQKAARV